MTKSIKKFNSEKVATILNKEFPTGIKKKKFEANGSYVSCFDFDRGSRGDVEHMSEIDHDKETKKYIKKYWMLCEKAQTACKKAGFAVKAGINKDEKGWIFMGIDADTSIKITEKKKETKKPAIKRNPIEKEKADPRKKIELPKTLNQTDQIREYIKKAKSHKSMIDGLAKAFDKTEKWAKSRLNTYEKAYGNMGINDAKLAK